MCKPPKFKQNFQEYFKEHRDNVPIQNLRECFATAEDMEEYFREQDQALTNRRDHMRTTWARPNQEF